MIQATCAECGKAYKVPEAGKSYSCKACGGVVAAPAPPSNEIEDSRDCPACGAVMVHEGAYCEECGASMSDESDETPRGDPAERRAANREMGKVKKTIRVVRTIYIIFAVLAGLGTVVVSIGLFAGDLDPAAAMAVRVAFVFLLLSTVTYILGAVRIMREPLLWSLLIASLTTLNVLASFAMGGLPVLWTIAALAFWSAVFQAARVRRFMQSYPELWNARKIAKSRSRSRAARGRLRGRVSTYAETKRGRR